MAKFKDLTGQRFSRLEVIELNNKEKSGNRYRYYWKCLCDCKTIINVRTDCLTSGYVRSCGCLHNEQAIKNFTAHYSHEQSGTRLYGIWQKMKGRCFNSNTPCYKRYGGRGITVCDEWKNGFQAFYEWSMSNGYSDDLTIDRIDNNGNYEPSNCRWVTNKEQSLNRRTNVIVQYNGKTMTLIEASQESGLPYSALSSRWSKGIRGNELFAEVAPKGNKREILYDGKIISLKELSEITGINLNTLKTRYRSGKRGNDLIK